MTGVDPKTAQHYLNISPDARPVKQKPQQHAPDRQLAIREEVEQLLAADFIKEVNLNRACPKDCYPLPRIDQLVDATAGHARLSFMDAFFGYNQIRMAPEDQEHTTFLTDLGVYFYKVISFGLKNVGATYQRAVNKMFAQQIGWNIEVYIDDMIVKSRTTMDHLTDLAETFATLRRYGLRLNPTKCAFGVSSGRFLGFIVHERGIDANPEKVQAIIGMQTPQTIKDLQRLNGRLAALSRSGDRCLPFFRALKNPKNFQWMTQCEEAFEQVKQHLANLPRLASVSFGEKLSIYLATSWHAVSSVLTKEASGEQLPVYYISHVLNGPEERYPPIERLALALVLVARKLCPYFQAHLIEVITDQLLRQVLSKFDVAGRLLKWSVELGEFDIHYVPRTAIKAQSIADFISELAQIKDEGSEQSGEAWVLHVDRLTTSSGAGAGLVLSAPNGRSFERSFRFRFQATNNEAEYEALLAGLRLALEMQVNAIHVLTDSRLVAEQINGGYEARKPTMAKYLAEVKSLTSDFSHFTISRVPRSQNERADELAKLASRLDPKTQPEIEELPFRAISVSIVSLADVHTTWVQEMLRFKRDEILPADEDVARCIRRMQAWYSEVNGRLYKRSFSYPLLRCLGPEEAQTVLVEVHEGICGEHIVGRTLAYKILHQGYYWPTMSRDARSYVQRCSPCQRHTRTARQSAVPLAPIDSEVQLGGPPPDERTGRGDQPIYFGWAQKESVHGQIGLGGRAPKYLMVPADHPQNRNRRIPLQPLIWDRGRPTTQSGFPYPSDENYDERVSTQGLQASLDLLKERCADAHLKDLSYKRAIARIYNRKVRPQLIKLGDPILRKAEVSDPTRARGKLALNWEGPYRVIGVAKIGTYRLATM
ncbi:uncharacterized protein LOC135594082 [Musa acuminata AAA Group]|uniref:uncharacterized protein LOC135594082 n=1 Tax=Musa acuminata AAA Group TaxID=214697 RepID=UPI0031CF5D23